VAKVVLHTPKLRFLPKNFRSSFEKVGGESGTESKYKE
jgi:hypothetical protein